MAQRMAVESAAEAAACLKFLQAELGWADFRAEFFADAEAAGNFAKLEEFLARTGHGLRLLQRLDEMEKCLFCGFEGNAKALRLHSAECEEHPLWPGPAVIT